MVSSFKVKGAELHPGWKSSDLDKLTYHPISWNFEQQNREIAIEIPKHGYFIWHLKSGRFTMDFVPAREIKDTKRKLKALHESFHRLEEKYSALLQFVTDE